MTMERLESGQSASLVYTLPRNRLYRIATTVDSDGEVLVEMYHDLSGMRERSAGEGGQPYVYGKGRSFTLITTDLAPGGYWFLRVRNLSNFPEVVTFDSYAAEMKVVADESPVKSWRETVVCFNGKPSPKVVAKPVAPKHRGPDLYAAMMAQAKKT